MSTPAAPAASEVQRALAAYEGAPLLQRLLHMARLREPTALAALLRALRDSDQTEFFRKFAKPLLDSDVAEISAEEREVMAQWQAASDLKMRELVVAAEAEVRTATASMLKDSIRPAMLALAALYLRWGKLEEAQKELLRSRDFCSTPLQHCALHLQLMTTSLYQGHYINTVNFVHKVLDASSEPAVVARTKVVHALYHLHCKEFAEVASKLLSVGGDLDAQGSEALSAADVGLCAALCALASLDRPALKRQLLDNKPFLQRFVLGDPQLRALVQAAAQSQHAALLAALRALQPRLAVDLHLAVHAEGLLQQAVQQLVLQYLAPYSHVTFERVARDLGFGADEAAALLLPLIQQDRLAFRIDVQGGALVRQAAQASHDAQAVSELVRAHLSTVQTCLLRCSLLEQRLFDDREGGSGRRNLVEPYEREDPLPPGAGGRAHGAGFAGPGTVADSEGEDEGPADAEAEVDAMQTE